MLYRQQADDIAQEAYIKAYMSIGKVRKSDSFKGWIYRIGYNVFIDMTRTNHRWGDIDSVRHIKGGSEADTCFQYQDLYNALKQLHPGERTSILLYYIEGYSIREISELQNKTPDAIKQNLSRGRRALRGLLEQ